MNESLKILNKIHEHFNIVKTISVIFIIVLCLAAMFHAPAMGPHTTSQYATMGPSLFTVIVVGFAIGCYGTIVGIGGGPLIIPTLFVFYGWDSEVLVATSLFIVFLNATSGSIGYALQKRLVYKSGFKFAIAAIPGAIISGFVHHSINIPIFNVIFGVFLILLAIYTFTNVSNIDRLHFFNKKINLANCRRVKFTDKFGIKYDFYSDDLLGFKVNFFLGFFVGFLGIGGGVFQVPMLLFFLYYPAHIATATSHLITMLTCLIALIPHLALGNVAFSEGIWMGLGVIAGAQLGAALAPKIKSKWIIYLFIIVLIMFAIKLIL